MRNNPNLIKRIAEEFHHAPSTIYTVAERCKCSVEVVKRYVENCKESNESLVFLYEDIDPKTGFDSRFYTSNIALAELVKKAS